MFRLFPKPSDGRLLVFWFQNRQEWVGQSAMKFSDCSARGKGDPGIRKEWYVHKFLCCWSTSPTLFAFFFRLRREEDIHPVRTHLSCTTLKQYLLDYDHSIGGLDSSNVVRSAVPRIEDGFRSLPTPSFRSTGYRLTIGTNIVIIIWMSILTPVWDDYWYV